MLKQLIDRQRNCLLFILAVDVVWNLGKASAGNGRELSCSRCSDCDSTFCSSSDSFLTGVLLNRGGEDLRSRKLHQEI
ncbi:hypothetical protein KOW79_006972 [Hemibagrus wyckioides]|uniref:Secreted protein n=1 Tax=Hemibagrus wyckioides TaxID=337641 RepID=A0A9D3NWX4_9TELE|nr:hypothetical protein KOW79_006972 [Hemibagrus wyckioides]